MRILGIKKLLVLFLLLPGLYFTGQGGWIQAKALLAQALLQQAWTRTLKDGGVHPPWSWSDHWPVARLKVPGMDIDQIVLSGDAGNVLAFAPGHNANSGLPSDGKTQVISGHRDTHFAFLENIRAGEKLWLETYEGRYEYRVLETGIFDADRHLIQVQEGDDRLMLVTCYPFNALASEGTLRYLVTAELQFVEEDLTPPGPGITRQF